MISRCISCNRIVLITAITSQQLKSMHYHKAQTFGHFKPQRNRKMFWQLNEFDDVNV